MPSPDDCRANPPKVVSPMVLLPVLCADAFAPTPARKATPTSATRMRLCRRTGDLPTSCRRIAGDGCGCRLTRRTSPVAEGLVQHPGETVRLLPERDDRNGNTGED